MKKLKLALAALALITAMGFSGCSACDDDNPPVPTPPNVDNPNGNGDGDNEDFISVSATLGQLSVKDYEVEGYNFSKYFRISDNGASVSSKDYVNASAVLAKAGEYEAVCTYKEHTAKITVTVLQSDCKISVTAEKLTLRIDNVSSYDFKALFTVTADGKSIKITEAMISSDVKAEAGEYTVKATFFSASAEIKVTVNDPNVLEIINSYNVLELTLDELDGFDFKTLFSLYVGGVAERMQDEYIDASSLAEPAEGQTYGITARYEKDGKSAQATAYIKVVSKAELSVTAKNAVTYPNAGTIDLKTLFTVVNGSRPVEITDDMIEGEVDYSKEGDYAVTLSYGGKSATATVSIKLGVIFDCVSDVVTVEKGTDAASYDFGADFNVIINGIRFESPSISCFDYSGADFNTVGEYGVTAKIPYNTKAPSLSGVKFDYFTKTLTYKVVEKKTDYSVTVASESVVLPAGTEKYDFYSNITVIINGIRKKVYEDRDNQDITTCYGRLKNTFDFTSSEEQLVEIELYVFGVDAQPVTVSYYLRVDNGVTVTGEDRVIFSGTTVYARDLFEIYENGQPVTVQDGMVSGKIDLFTAGIYYLTAEYKGVSASLKTVVLDSSMAGRYKTLLTTIERIEDNYDDEGWDDLGYGDYAEPYTAGYAATRVLDDFTVGADGRMYIGTREVRIDSIIDESTFSVTMLSNEYILRYADGVITLDPLNSVRLAYHSGKRPMVYFNEEKWKAESYLQINSNSSGYSVYDLNAAGNFYVSNNSYTLDLFSLKPADGGENVWYGMKTLLISKYNADTYYADEVFGFATFAPDFTAETGCVSAVTLSGSVYEFTLSDSSKGIINKVPQRENPYAGIIFKGTVDGKPATFSVTSGEKATLTADGKKLFELTIAEQNAMKCGGGDYENNTYLLYDFNSGGEIFSYKIILDPEEKTFEIEEKDDLFGKYLNGKVSFFFDGYGTGEVVFNTDNKYITTAFSYERKGSLVKITYLNPDPWFKNGTYATFLFSDYKNVLTVREITGVDLVGAAFVNCAVRDGAIVEVASLTLGKNSAQKELFDGINITTAEGALTKEQMKGNIPRTKTPYVDTSRISYTTAGYYQLKINIPVNGEVKTAYYAVCVLEDIYAGNALVGRYYNSAVSSGGALNLDEYGRITGAYGGMTFSGTAKLSANKFTASAKCATGEKITVTGELLADGIIKVTAHGALMFTDCFTFGEVKTSGTEGYVLRAITVAGKTTFLLSNAETALGSIFTAEGDTSVGSIFKLTGDGKEYVVKVSGWDGAGKGLALSDALRGVYTSEGQPDLTLDGFGRATLGDKVGTYTAYGRGITVISGSEVKIFRLGEGTYTSGGTADIALFAGKSFEAEYNFFCTNNSNTPYKVITIFEFKAGGEVTVKSSSAEHDEDCDDKYSPEFATPSGIDGKFTVAGNKITVEVNGKTVIFTFDDAVGLNKIRCSYTDVGSSTHGYFKADSEFTRV